MSGMMPNLFSNDKVINITASNFVEMPVSHRPRFYPPSANMGDHGAIILVYAPWCPHCADPEWIAKYKALAQLLSNYNTHAYAMNATIPENDEWTEKMKITGLPTILLANKKGEMAEYEGDRELTPMVEAFMDFMTQTNNAPSNEPVKKTSKRKTQKKKKYSKKKKN